MQELGETVDAVMADDFKKIEAILNEKKGDYWIVVAYKTTNVRMNTGEGVVWRMIKAYDKKPKPLLGTIVYTVKQGEIVDTQVNPHDAPIDWGAIIPNAGLEANPLVMHRPDIANQYIYNTAAR